MEKTKWIANDEQIWIIYPNYLRYRNYDVNDVVLNWGSSHNISALQRLESQVSVTT